MDFRNFFIPYFFEVKKSISRSFTKLPFTSDLENPDQLPVLQVLGGTGNWVYDIGYDNFVKLQKMDFLTSETF